MASDESVSLREARAGYFRENGFPEDGGYRARWVVLRVGGVPVSAFPNSDARRRAVLLHDLHHVLTGYATSWTGEAEIGAWELASGCRDYWAAWLLNAGAAAVGLLVSPRRTLDAYRRGRRTRNLYAEGFDERLLDESLGAARRRLGLDARGGISARSGPSGRTGPRCPGASRRRRTRGRGSPR